jgi:hypothetical protein
MKPLPHGPLILQISVYREVLGNRKIYNNLRFSGCDLPLHKQHMYRKVQKLRSHGLEIFRNGTSQMYNIILICEKQRTNRNIRKA